MRGDRVRLLDIQEAIERIEKYARQGQEAFEQEELIQTWIVHHLQIIGEAARALSSDLKDQHPEMPWSKMIGMRNILVHDYFGIDVDVVWAVVERDLPDLKLQIETILREVGE
ncbi:MAG: HepT-like ribonuclease domain-containing protein [Gammaproteobacteria bacterium]